MAQALGIEVGIKGIVVLQLVGPIVEIVVVFDQGKRPVQPAAHSRPRARALEYGEFRIVVVRHVEPLTAGVDPVVQRLEHIEVKDRRIALPALAPVGGHFEVVRAAGKFALDLKAEDLGIEIQAHDAQTRGKTVAEAHLTQIRPVARMTLRPQSVVPIVVEGPLARGQEGHLHRADHINAVVVGQEGFKFDVRDRIRHSELVKDHISTAGPQRRTSGGREHLSGYVFQHGGEKGPIAGLNHGLQPGLVAPQIVDFVGLDLDRAGQVRRYGELVDELVDTPHPQRLDQDAVGPHDHLVDLRPGERIVGRVVGKEDEYGFQAALDQPGDRAFQAVDLVRSFRIKAVRIDKGRAQAQKIAYAALPMSAKERSAENAEILHGVVGGQGAGAKFEGVGQVGGDHAKTALARRAVPADAVEAGQVQGHGREICPHVVADDQARRPAAKALFGHDELVEKAVVPTAARFKAAPDSRRVAAHFAEFEDIDAVDEQIAKEIKAAVFLLEVVVPVPDPAVVLKYLVGP